MHTLYLTTTQSTFSALDGSLNEVENTPIVLGDPIRLVVPRWLAEACRIEVEHDLDEWVNTLDGPCPVCGTDPATNHRRDCPHPV